MMESNKKNEFTEYIKKSKWVILIITLFALAAFGQRIISRSFSIDVEIYISNLNYNTVNWDWWTSLNRWGAVWLNKLLQPNSFLIFFTNLTTVITMIGYSIAFCFLFYKNIGDEYKEKFLRYQFIFPIIFITNPIFAEQYNFIHQNLSVALGILFIPLSLLMFEYADTIENKIEKSLLYIFGICIATVAFGVYQSIILVYIATVVVCYLLKVLKDNDNSWKYLIKQIIIFGIIVIVYEIITKLTGEKASYLQIVWFKDGIKICLRNIYYVIKDTIKCAGMYYNVGYLLGGVSIIAMLISLIMKKKLKIGVVISLIGIIMAPFYIMIITGVNQFYRTQFNYSFAVGIMLMLGIVFVQSDKKIIEIGKKIGLVLIIIVAYRQTYTTASLFNTADIIFENDVKIAEKITDRIQSKDWYDENKEYKLIFIGTYEFEGMMEYQKGEIIGESFFTFGKEDSCGISGRGNLFFNILGYDFKMPTVEEYYAARNFVKEEQMKTWPNDEAIKLMDDDKIVVKLSNE